MRLLALLLLAGAVAAQDKTTTVQQADRVLAAAKDPAALAKLAAMDQPDRWSVADELSSRGEHGIAVRFARATKLKDKERLVAYLESRRKSPTPRGTWAAMWPLWNRAFAGEKGVPEAAAPYVKQGGFVGSFATTIHAVSLVQTGRAAEAVPLLERALKTMEELGCLNDQAWNLFWLGRAVPEKAEHYYRRVLALEEDLFAKNAAYHLGHLLLEQGRPREAVPFLRLSVEHFGKRSPAARAELQTFLARALVASRQAAEGERVAAAAYPVLKKAGNDRFAAWALYWIAVARYVTGDLARAERLYVQALGLFRAQEVRGGVISCFHGLGNIALERSRNNDALRHFEAALAHAPPPSTRTTLLRSCGVAERRLGRLGKAVERFQAARALARKPGETADVLCQLAQIAIAREDSAAAKRLLDEAGAHVEKSGDDEVRASYFWSLSDFYRTTDKARAIELMRSAIALYLKLGMPLKALRLHTNLVATLTGLKRKDEAIRSAEQAVALADRTPDLPSRTEARLGLANALNLAGRYEEALAIVDRELGARAHESSTTSDLQFIAAEALEFLGRRTEALARYEAALAKATDVKRARRAGEGASRQATLIEDFERWLAVALRTQAHGRRLGDEALRLVGRGWEGAARSRRGEHDDAKRILKEVRDASEGVPLAITLGALGNAHKACGEFEEARACYERSLALLREAGNELGELTALSMVAGFEQLVGNFATAERRYRELHTLAVERKADKAQATALKGLGDMHHLRRHELDEAARCYEQARAICAKRKDAVEEAECLHRLAGIHDQRGEVEKARARAAEALRRLGPLEPPVKASLLCNLAMSLISRGKPAEARATIEQARTLSERRGDARGLEESHATLAVWHESRGELAAAYEAIGAALALAEKRPNRWQAGRRIRAAMIATQLNRLDEAEEHLAKAREAAAGRPWYVVQILNETGRLRHHQFDYAASLAAHKEATRVAGAAGLESLRHLSESWIAAVMRAQGRYADALALERRLLEEAARFGSVENAAVLQMSHAVTLMELGRLPEAIAILEQAHATLERTGARLNASRALRRIGLAHAEMNDHRTAMRYEERALAISRELGARRHEAVSLGNLSAWAGTLGNLDTALRFLEQASAIRRELGLSDHMNISRRAALHLMRGERKKARELYEQAVAEARRLREAHHVPLSLSYAGRLTFDLGERDKGIAMCREALRLAEELRMPHDVLETMHMLAIVLAQSKRHEEAVALAHRGVKIAQGITRGLADEQAAMMRGKRFRIAETGIFAAINLGRIDDAFHFMESARAGALLESLGGRQQLRAAVLPPEFQKADAEARAAERNALERYERAIEKGGDADAAWKQVERARARVVETVARIQREQKARADVPFPRAASLAEVRARLGKGEAAVFFEVLDERVLAVIATRDRARLEDLGEPKPILTAVERFRAAVQRPDERGLVRPPHLRLPRLTTRLKKLLVEPLKLKAKRVLVSPDQELAYVPFARLLDVPVAYVPSGTTYTLLDGKPRGKKVLALGDPAYGGKHTRLPESGKEAQAVGDVVLLRDRATKAGLLGAKGPWRAVHLACHAWVDPARPQLSALALADGDLRCLDVFAMELSADLVVLSACETAKGKVYKAEGVVGFTRAFMIAGAPRVIVSLWKVDDAATRALMVEFYKLWKEFPAATALAKAQEHVRSQEKWEHPYYWAAWQLWGLAE